MTNQLQTQQHLQSRIPTTFIYRQILACRNRNKGLTNDQSSTKDREKWKGTGISSNFQCFTYVYSILIGDTNQTRRYAREIVHHDRSTYELQYDGSIIITPYPRQLPNEIISLIMHQLSDNLSLAKEYKTLFECTLVSHQFYAIVNPILWKVLNFHQNISSERFLTCLSDAPPWKRKLIGHHIRELYLHGPHWKDTQLILLLPYLRRLKCLTIDDDTCITDKGFKRLPYRCPLLTSLHLDSSNLTELSFSAIGIHCRKVCDLVWNIKKYQSSEWLEMITLPCPFKHLQIKSLFRPLPVTVITTIKTFHRLTSLDIMDMNSDHMNNLLRQNTTTTGGNHSSSASHRPSSLQHIPHWPYLKKLTLHPCNELDDTTLIAFIKSHSYLDELHLKNATRLTDRTLDHIALPNLMHMTLTDNHHISTDGVRRLVHQCGRLVHLNLARCGQLLPSDFPELWELHDAQELVMDHRIINRVRLYQTQQPQRPLDPEQRRLADMMIQRLERQQQQGHRQQQLIQLRQDIQVRQSQLRYLRQREHRLEQEIQQLQQQR